MAGYNSCFQLFLLGKQGLTPEQQKKRERFMQSRLKKQEEERVKKEFELEKKRR